MDGFEKLKLPLHQNHKINMTLSLLATIAPGIAISMLFISKTARKRTPWLVISFILGVLSVIPTTILSLIGMYVFDFYPESNNMSPLISCVIGIGLVEEYSKFIFVRHYTMERMILMNPLMVLYTVMVSWALPQLKTYHIHINMANLRRECLSCSNACHFAITLVLYGYPKVLAGKNYALIGSRFITSWDL